jgi:leader peptidase (prepilin peptidase) / N-methyltransferase
MVTPTPTEWWTLLAFTVFVGACVGSFLNVVAGRLPEGRSISHPPSACPHCKHPIRPWHNVPVLGWMVLRGKCKDCSEPISVRYPLVEAGCAAMWALLFVTLVPNPAALGYPVEALLPLLGYELFFSALLAISLIDADHFIVPDEISLPLIPLGIATLAMLHAAGMSEVSFVDATFGAIAGAGVMLAIRWVGFLIFRREAMGMGDVKLVSAIGAWMGLHPAIFLTIFGGSVIGSVVGISVSLIRRGKPPMLPFGPYLCGGALAAFVWGDQVMAMMIPTL